MHNVGGSTYNDHRHQHKARIDEEHKLLSPRPEIGLLVHIEPKHARKPERKPAGE